jgi:hypothetical protein
LLQEVAEVIAPLGLRLAADKTRVVHIDDGFDFLGHTIVRRVKRGTSKTYVFTFPSAKAMHSDAVHIVQGEHATYSRKVDGGPVWWAGLHASEP